MMTDIYDDYHSMRLRHDELFDKCKSLQAEAAEKDKRIADLEDKVSVQSYFLKQYHEAEDIADKRIAELEGGTQPINILLTEPPSPTSQFVEVELDNGKGINAGEWIEREDGFWSLRITELPPKGGDL